MSLLQTCRKCEEELALSEFYAHRQIYRWEKRLYIRKVCKDCYKKQQNFDRYCERIRKEWEKEAREYRRKLLKSVIKVLIGLVIVGWIFAVVAKGA